MMSKIALIICFSVLLSGCSTFYPTFKEKWTLPPQPKIEKIKIEKAKGNLVYFDGFYLTTEDATKIANNVDELKAYIQKLEILVKEMAKYYGAKVEDK